MNKDKVSVNIENVNEIRLLENRKLKPSDGEFIDWRPEKNRSWFERTFLGLNSRKMGFYSWGNLMTTEELSDKYVIIGIELFIKDRVVIDYGTKNSRIVYFDSFKDAEELFNKLTQKNNFFRIK